LWIYTSTPPCTIIACTGMVPSIHIATCVVDGGCMYVSVEYWCHDRCWRRTLFYRYFVHHKYFDKLVHETWRSQNLEHKKSYRNLILNSQLLNIFPHSQPHMSLDESNELCLQRVNGKYLKQEGLLSHLSFTAN